MEKYLKQIAEELRLIRKELQKTSKPKTVEINQHIEERKMNQETKAGEKVRIW